MGWVKVLIFLAFFVVTSSGFQTCKVSYKFKSRCNHFDIACYETLGPDCPPKRVSYTNPRCPVLHCVSFA